MSSQSRRHTGARQYKNGLVVELANSLRALPLTGESERLLRDTDNHLHAALTRVKELERHAHLPHARIEAALEEFILDIVQRALRSPALRLEQLIALRAELENSTPSEYLRTEEAAAIAGVTPGTIRAWVRSGVLAGCKAGRLLRIPRVELERFLHERRSVSVDARALDARATEILESI